jgi:hypothetical protein
MSGLDVVVDACLFFRNTAAYVGGGLYFINAVPGTLLVNNTEFSHNYGFVTLNLGSFQYDAKVGVQGRRNTCTIANTHVDGGGLPCYGANGISVATYYGETADGTINDVIFERVTAVDIIAFGYNPQAINCNGNGLRDFHCVMRECRVARTVGVEGPELDNRMHSNAISAIATTSFEVSRLTLEDSGSFVDGSRGYGTLYMGDDSWKSGYTGWKGFPPNTEYRVVDSKFVHNQAARGGAICLKFYQIQVAVRRCYFEVGVLPVNFGSNHAKPRPLYT